MKNYIVYNDFTGEILRTGVCSDESFPHQALETPEDIIEGTARDATQYIDTVNLIVLDKDENPATIDKTSITADGIDEAIISNLANPCYVMVEGKRYLVTDGTFEFTVDTAGTYTIVLDGFPYLIKEFVINAS